MKIQDFLKVFFIIILVQAVIIVNAGLVPLDVFTWIGNMFSYVPFWYSRLDSSCSFISDYDSSGYVEKACCRQR